MPATMHQLFERSTGSAPAVDSIYFDESLRQQPPLRRSTAVRSMNAAFITRTGDVEVIRYGKLPRPSPTPGQVLVKVGAAAVNPIDLEIRSGMRSMPLSYPYVIGSDVAGTVVTRGLGVRRFSEGDRVWGSNQGLFGRQGTFAEYVAIDEKWLYPTPQEQSDAEAAAGAMVGISASLGLFHAARVRQGELVFVACASGGVGSAVIQQAKAAGARVIAAAGSRTAQEYCRNLQADLVLDDRSPAFYDQIRAFIAPSDGIDVWIDAQREPTLHHAIEMMARGGRIVLIGEHETQLAIPSKAFRAKNLALLAVSMHNALPDLQRKYALALNARYAYGRWRPHVGMTFSLSQAAEAQQLQETNLLAAQEAVLGKIVVAPNQ